MKNLAIITLVLTFNTSLSFAAFDCTTLKNKEDKMACLKDLRLLENKYLSSDACAKFNTPKSQDEYKLCEAVEKKKDPCYGYKKYGTQEGSDYERCYIGKESAKADMNVSDLKRESKSVERNDSAPLKVRLNTSGR